MLNYCWIGRVLAAFISEAEGYSELELIVEIVSKVGGGFLRRT